MINTDWTVGKKESVVNLRPIKVQQKLAKERLKQLLEP